MRVKPERSDICALNLGNLTMLYDVEDLFERLSCKRGAKTTTQRTTRGNTRRSPGMTAMTVVRRAGTDPNGCHRVTPAPGRVSPSRRCGEPSRHRMCVRSGRGSRSKLADFGTAFAAAIQVCTWRRHAVRGRLRFRSVYESSHQASRRRADRLSAVMESVLLCLDPILLDLRLLGWR
jgi:hypothetical protein